MSLSSHGIINNIHTSSPRKRSNNRHHLNLSSSSQDDRAYQINVSYQGLTTTMTIYSDETILDACERNAVHDTLGLPWIPFDCRRGNCLSCVSKHKINSRMEHVIPSSRKSKIESTENENELDESVLYSNYDNGLSPSLSRHLFHNSSLEYSDWVITCSSMVTGHGVDIELGVRDDAWEEIYKKRFSSPEEVAIRQQVHSCILFLFQIHSFLRRL